MALGPRSMCHRSRGRLPVLTTRLAAGECWMGFTKIAYESALDACKDDKEPENTERTKTTVVVKDAEAKSARDGETEDKNGDNQPAQ